MWKKYFREAQNDHSMKLDDQTLFWNALRKSPESDILPLSQCSHQSTVSEKFVTCHPDVCQAGAAGVWTPTHFSDLIGNLTEKNLSMVAVHANYLVGNEMKRKHLDRHGLWLATHHADGTWGKCKELKIKSE